MTCEKFFVELTQESEYVVLICIDVSLMSRGKTYKSNSTQNSPTGFLSPTLLLPLWNH